MTELRKLLKCMVNIFILIFFLISTNTIFSQTPIHLSLFEAFDLATNESNKAFFEKSNFQIKHLRNELFYANRKPKISISSNIDYENYDHEFSAKNRISWNNSLGLSVPIPILNSSLSLSKPISYAYSFSDKSSTNEWNSWGVQFKTNNLFLPNRYKTRKQEQGQLYDYEKKEFTADKFYLERDIVLSYFALLSEREKRDMLLHFKKEISSSFLIHKLENQIIGIDVIINAKERELRLLTQIDSSYTIQTTLPRIIDTIYIDEHYVDSLIENNPSLSFGKYRIVTLKNRLNVSKKKFLYPSLTFGYYYNSNKYQSYNPDFRKGLTAFDASINIPILNWGIRKKETESNRLAYEQSLVSYENTRINITNEVQVLVQEINSMPQRLSSSKNALTESKQLINDIIKNSTGSPNDMFAMKYAIETRIECMQAYYRNVGKYYECLKRLSALCLYDFESNSANLNWTPDLSQFQRP